MQNKIFAILIITLLIFSTSLVAASNAKVMRFSPNEGLAQSHVRSLLVDRNGYLWIATRGGLNRYDGYRLSTVSGPDNFLRDKSIDFLYEDTQGDIWIATTFSGLYRYRANDFSFERVLSFLSDGKHSPITMLETHQAGFYWFGRVHDLALLNAQTGEIKSVFKIPSDYEYPAVRVLKYYKNYLLVGTTEGLFVMDLSTQKVMPINFLNEAATHPDQYNTKSFYIDNDTLWLGTVQGLHRVSLDGLDALFSGEGAPLATELVISDLNIWQIMPFQGTLKLATNQGVYDYFTVDDQLIKSTELDNSDFVLSDPSVVDMLLSPDGSMWLASKTDGAFFVAKNNYAFQNYNRETLQGGLAHNNIWRIVQYQNDIWLATKNGLTKVNLQTYQSQSYLQGYLADRLTNEFDVYEFFEFENTFWLSTNRGLFTFDPNTLEVNTVPSPDDEYPNLFTERAIIGHVTEQGDAYLKSFKYGYFKYNLKTQDLLKLDTGIVDLGGDNPGYFIAPLEGETLPTFFHKKSLYQVTENNNFELIYTLPVGDEVAYVDFLSHTTDNNNVLWLSYSSYGLVGIDRHTFELVHRIDDKRDNRGSLFYDLIKDNSGMIWMTSHKGLWRFDPNTLHFRQFTVEDGIAVNEFNGGASLVYSDDRIIYGSIRGITSFFPARNNTKSPLAKRVNITSLALMSRNLDAEQIIRQNILELDYDDIGLEIGFSAMLFKHQERVEYEYRLDQSTLIKTLNNKVSFGRISPGKHTFYVRARDPLTGEYTEFKSFTIQVNYPPWRSPAAFAIYFILIASIVSVWLSRRHRYQQRLLAAHKRSSENEARLKMALESSKSGVWEWQSGNGYIFQPRLTDELGYSKNEVQLDEYLSKIHPEDRAKYRIEWLEFVSTDKADFNLTYRVRHAQGHWRWYKDVGCVIDWVDGLPQQVSGTYTNFTHERNLEHSARLFGAAFEHTRDWVFVMDTQFSILAINKALRESYQFDVNKDSSRKLTLGLSPKRRAYYLRALKTLKPGEHFSSEDIIYGENNLQHSCLIKVTAVANDSGLVDNYVVVITDISGQKEAELEVNVLTHFDTLTGLPNRTLFLDRVAHAMRLHETEQRALAILFIDLDKFKKINDSFGHANGDEVLKEISARCVRIFSELDTVARLNADEFAVLIESANNTDDIAHLCERLIAEINQPIMLAEHKIILTASIGVGFYPSDGKTAEKLVNAADMAMFHAKKQGGDRFLFFSEEMNIQVQQLLALESNLKIAQRNNEIENYYQPIIESKQQQVIGFETLMRWQHEGEFINPARFIAIAESIELITVMTMSSLEKALQDVLQWREVAPACYVSVNLSAKAFHQADLAERILALCTRYQVPCDALALEITESILLSDFDSAKLTMDRLRQAGCRIYLDDFGTGYSSLTYLKRFPIDVIKIDHSFVKNIGENTDDEAIIRSTLALAHSLGKQCIAEGVENAEQVEYLQNNNCVCLQGYYFSKPLQGDEVLPFIASYQ